jgi:hypothetical protein
MGQFISKTRRGSIIFNVEVEIRAEQAEAFAGAMTGNDDDIFLAAETAMRERVGRVYDVESEELEVGIPDESDVRDALRRFGQENTHL